MHIDLHKIEKFSVNQAPFWTKNSHSKLLKVIHVTVKILNTGLWTNGWQFKHFFQILLSFLLAVSCLILAWLTLNSRGFVRLWSLVCCFWLCVLFWWPWNTQTRTQCPWLQMVLCTFPDQLKTSIKLVETC